MEKKFHGSKYNASIRKTEKIARDKIIKRHQANGVRFIDSSSVFIDGDVVLASGVTDHA